MIDDSWDTEAAAVRVLLCFFPFSVANLAFSFANIIKDKQLFVQCFRTSELRYTGRGRRWDNCKLGLGLLIVTKWMLHLASFPLTLQYSTETHIFSDGKMKHAIACVVQHLPVFGVWPEASDVHRNIIASQPKHPLEFLMKSEKEPATGPLDSSV